jgi:hypothetical protein
VASRGGLGAEVKRETCRLFRESNPDSETELSNSRREKKDRKKRRLKEMKAR